MNIWLLAKLIWTIRRLRYLPGGLAVMLLVSCGGGDDGDTTRYQSVATAGELIDYTVDTANLTYSYTIIESEYGLAGRTVNGTLTRNPDGTYTPSGATDARLIILPSGLLLGAVRERFGPDESTMPIVGVKDPTTSIAGLATDYNYVQSSCRSAVCSTSYGTLRIGSAGAWSSCRDGNLAAGACTGEAESGTIESHGDGLWRLKSSDGTDIGSVTGFDSNGQKVVIVDLKDRRADGFGIGLLIGGQAAAMTTRMTNGTWVAATGSGHWFRFTATGPDIAISQFDWQPVSIDTSFAANDPWTGMATTAWGEVGFFAAAGLYMLATPAGDVEIGVKLH